MEWGEMLTRGLAQLAVACYLVRVLADIGGWHSLSIARANRWVWSIGCAALWLHVAAAFHFIHHWSHAEAVRQTAEQTRQLTGWSWGGGVYINYAFAFFWLMDVAFLWRRGLKPDSRSAASFWTIHSMFGFMMFNATVVFGPLYWRYVGLVFAGLGIAAWFIRRRGLKVQSSQSAKK
jgi:hypothetical protein